MWSCNKIKHFMIWLSTSMICVNDQIIFVYHVGVFTQMDWQHSRKHEGQSSDMAYICERWWECSWGCCCCCFFLFFFSKIIWWKSMLFSWGTSFKIPKMNLFFLLITKLVKRRKWKLEKPKQCQTLKKSFGNKDH